MKGEVQNMVNHEENQVESTPCKLNISINEHDTFSIGKSANPDTYKLTVGQKIYRGLKAAMDFLIALVALIVISPPFLLFDQFSN